MKWMVFLTLHYTQGRPPVPAGATLIAKIIPRSLLRVKGFVFCWGIFTEFDKDDIIKKSEGGRSTPKGGGRMSTNDVLTLGLLIVAVIDLVYKIVAKK